MNYADYKTLFINGQRLEGSEIITYCQESHHANLKYLGEFVREWLNDETVIELNTSGSTGTPKTIRVRKSQMLQSAAMTATFFGFAAGQTALLCLPISYIAGKMMVVRALYSGLNLYCIEPGSAPLSGLPEGVVIDFAPLTPMQLVGIENTPSVRKILLGGSPVPLAVEEKLQLFGSEVYQGYGMTETLSHVAIRRVNGPGRSDIYTALPGIVLETDDRNCLVIQAPFLSEKVYTNDVAELIGNQRFIWKGRADHVINSGGIKLFPEEIEKKIFPLIIGQYFIAGLPDNRLGEKLVLFVDGEAYGKDETELLSDEISKVVHKYEKPREIIFVRNFITTASGKINRQATIRATGKV